MGKLFRKTFWRTLYRTDHSVWFIGWVLPYNCERPVKNPSICKESLTWIVPWTRAVRGGNLERWRTDRRPWGVGNDGRIGNLLEKTQYERGDISPRKRRIKIFQSQMDESKPLEEIRNWEHPAWFSWRIRRISSTTSRLTSRCRWSYERFLVHVGKLHITLLVERGIIPYSTEIHWCIQNYSYEFGCQAREVHRWLLEYRWDTRLVWSLGRFHTIHSTRRKSSRRMYVVRVEINEKTADIQARSFMTRTLEINGKARQVEGEAKVVWW